MGRKQRAVRTVGPAAAFAQLLRDARAEHGNPSFRRMSQVEGGLSYGTLAKGVTGERMPTWKFTEAYLRGCGITDDDTLRDWRRMWRTASERAEIMPSRPRLEPGAMPDPRQVRTYEQLISQLKLLKLAAGNLPYRDFYFGVRPAKRTTGTPQSIPHSTISNMFTGKHISSRPQLYMQIVRGLVQHVTYLYGANPEDRSTPWADPNAWHNAWITATAHHRITRSTAQQRPPDKGDLILWIAADDPTYAAYLLEHLDTDRRVQVLRDLPLDVADSVLHARPTHHNAA